VCNASGSWRGFCACDAAAPHIYALPVALASFMILLSPFVAPLARVRGGELGDDRGLMQ
jgi:hypothetical protein